MKLLSATVRNYRVHREIGIDFDQSRTLIGGPNETGKSTLIEAIHRGLFLKSTVTGEAQKSMMSTLFPGHPEVEIRFVSNDAEFHLTKRFSGQNGTTKLVQVGGQTWQGEEAESRLAGLLGVEELGGGRGILGRVSEQWSHLWVWQGMSGDEPSDHAASQQARLLQQLQQSGGAIAMQSELDGRVASRFAHAKSLIFVRSGNVKAGSELDRAQAETQEAKAGRTAAEERLDKLRQAIQDFEDASATIQRATADLGKLRQQRQGVKEKIVQAEELERTRETQASAVENAIEKLTVLEGIEEKIGSLRDSIITLKQSLEPKQKEERRLESALSDGRRRTSDAEREYDEATQKTREVRLRKELATAYVNQFDKAARNMELQTRLKRVQRLENELEGLRKQMVQLASIDQAGLDALQKKENELAQASAAVTAMAAEIEVIASAHPVRVGDAELNTGDRQTVTEPTEVNSGDLLSLRIRPGGGDSLADAREKLRVLREELRRSLDNYGLESIAKASEVVAQRTDLESKMANAKAAISELDSESLAESCTNAKEELTAIEAEVVRRREQVADAQNPQTLAQASTWRDREEENLRTVESEETALKAVRDTLQQEQGDREKELNNLRTTIAGEKQDLTGFEAQLTLLLDSHGDDEKRTKALEDARKFKKDAQDSLAQTRAAIENLQPELLAADRERLQRAIEETERQEREAQTQRAVSQSTLRLDGSVDPNAELARANARLAASTEHMEAVERKGKAIALIDSLFQQEQRTLADRFSQPLAQKINGYLQCLFGPDARAGVTFEDNAFKGIHLVRSTQEGATSFASLSGGTREQVAAAVRLAIAELLSADHGNSLPICQVPGDYKRSS